FLYTALIVKLLLSPAFSSGIVYVHLLPSILPALAETRVTWLGALSVTTASFRVTLPVLRTVLSYVNSVPTGTFTCSLPFTVFSMLIEGASFSSTLTVTLQFLLVGATLPSLIVTMTSAV